MALSASDIEQIKKEFGDIDRRGTQTVGVNAVAKVLQDLDEWSAGELHQLFAAVGGNSQNSLPIADFLEWVLQPDEEDDPPMPGAIEEDYSDEEDDEVSNPTVRFKAKNTRGLAGLEPVTTELSLQEWMMLSRLLELDLEEAESSFDHWEMKKNNEVCKACGAKFYPDAKYCHNCGKKRPTLAELQAARSQQHVGFVAARSGEKVPLAAFLDEHGIKQSDHDSLEHVQDMLEMARQKLANGESYLDHATDNALAVAVSQVLWGISQKRKPAESCWEVVDDGTVVLSQAGRKAIERLRSRPDDLVAKVKEANIQPPLLPSHAGRQGNRENCVTSVQAIVEKCNKEGTKYTDPRFDICADPAKALYVDAHQPGYDCTVAKPAGYKRLTEIIDEPVLFKGGVRPADIIQGQIGTCFFLGALGAMVGEDPDNVRSCFLEHDIDVGVYGIRFFLDGEWYHTIIDDWMPVDQYGRLLYAKSYDHDEVWVPLLEKAFCKMHTCYEMCDGGLPGEAVSLLFGGAMGKFKIKEKTRYKPLAAGVYYETLHDAHEAGWVLSTTFTKFRAAGGKAGQGKCGEGITNDGLVHGHVYSVLRVVEAFGNKLVCCRNPWGQGEWKGKWSDANSFGEWTPEMKEATNYRGGDDGTFWMSIEDFLATSGGVHYSRTIGCKWKMLSQYSYFQTGEMKATALWTYKERADDEIGFWKGDKIQVDRIAPGWWTGSTDGTSKSGFFPGNYVKLDDRPISRFDLDSTEKTDAKDTMTAVVMLIQPLAHRQRRFYKRKQDGLNYKDTSYPRVMLLVVGPDGRAELKKEGKLRELSGEIELRGGHGVWKVYATCMEGGGTPFTVRAYIKDGTATLTEITGAKLSEISEYV